MIDNKPIAVIGAGNSGLAMAAHLKHNKEKVHLWNRSYRNIEALSSAGTVHCEGIIKGDYGIDIITSEIDAALYGVDLILVTAPANAHHDIAIRIAPFLRGNELIVLNPGRTMGAIEFTNILNQLGYRKEITVAETQTIVYTCRKTDSTSVIIYAMKNNVLLSCLEPCKNKLLINRLPYCLQGYFVPAKNIIQTSIGNVGMILHCIPTLFNTGWIESPKTSFKYYYEGITPSLAIFLEKLDQERLAVAAQLGYTVETTKEWLKRSFNLQSNNLYECIQENKAYQMIDAPLSLQHRYILEDVPYGLVPLEAIGQKLGLRMMVTKMIIDLASELLNLNFRQIGRSLKCLGLENKTPQEIIRFLNGKDINK